MGRLMSIVEFHSHGAVLFPFLFLLFASIMMDSVPTITMEF